MACGLPQIVNEATTGEELVKHPDTGIACKAVYPQLVSSLTDIFLIGIDELVDAMKEMYNNKDLREEYSKKAIKHAKKYNLKSVKQMWVDLIDLLESSKNKEEVEEVEFHD